MATRWCKRQAYLHVQTKVSAIAFGVLMSTGCGLYESPHPYQGPVDGEACGPSGMGTYSVEKGECVLGPLDQVVQASAEDRSLVFVHPKGKKDGTGSKDEPLRSVTGAMQVAEKRGADAVVIAGDEKYEGRVELKNGVSLVGGWNTSWARDEKVRPTLVSKKADGKGQNAALVGTEMRQPTYVRNLVVKSAGAGKTKYGARLVDVKGLRIENSVIRAGDGEKGADGANGDAGTDGGDGKNGGQPSTADAGVKGTNPDCSKADGGAGGRGGLENNSGSRAGESGEGSEAGVKGGGASEDGFDGENGDAGKAGADGKRGGVNGERWDLGRSGESGTSGEHGEGGGGGGGGRVSGGDGVGGGGGGGGAGGCGGQGGEGGESGGASLGMLLVDSEVTLRNSEVVGANGGAGGAGGDGGSGGAGGNGGNGAKGEQAGQQGGDGGDGGRGGSGGAGGDGRGGVSYGVVCDGNTSVDAEKSTVQAGDGGKHGGDLKGRAESKKAKGCKSFTM